MDAAHVCTWRQTWSPSWAAPCSGLILQTLVAIVFPVVRSGTVERGCIPVENSLAGTIHKNYDLLLAHEDLHIVGEVSIPISHCLMANKGVALGEVKRVLSHPVALDQCETFIRNHQL